MDRHSRRTVGWSLSARRDAALTSEALQHAARNRQPEPGIVFHSGSDPTSAAVRLRILSTTQYPLCPCRAGRVFERSWCAPFPFLHRLCPAHFRAFRRGSQRRSADRERFVNRHSIHPLDLRWFSFGASEQFSIFTSTASPTLSEVSSGSRAIR